MTHDFTYLDQLTVEDLLDRAHRGNWNGPEAHMIRALAVRLEDYLEFRDIVSNLEAELGDAERRAEGWREEAQARHGARVSPGVDLSSLADAELLRLLLLGDAAYKEAVRRNLIEEKAAPRDGQLTRR